MRLRDLSYRGLAIITGLVVLLPELLKMSIFGVAYLVSPEAVSFSGKIKYWVWTLA